MIIKEASISIKIRKLEALLRRLPILHPKRKEVEEELARSNAGFRGEKSIDFHLELFPKGECFIFHDLRLAYASSYFQLDILILTPYFFLILEVKNISGTLIFDNEFHQLIRVLNGMEENFPDPISQIYRQKFLIQEWIKDQRMPAIPIESLVVISNPLTRIKTIPEKSNLSKIVTHSSNLLAKFHGYTKIYKEEKISKKELKKLSRLLLKQHTQNSPDLLQKFGISEDELIRGVFCPNCKSFKMTRCKNKWYCPICEKFSKDAHVQTLKDFALLFGPTITNSQCRDFLQISSRFVAHHILHSLNFSTTGTKRHRKYHMEFTEFDT